MLGVKQETACWWLSSRMAVLSAASNGVRRTHACLQASTAGTEIVANDVQDKQVGASSAVDSGKPELDRCAEQEEV